MKLYCVQIFKYFNLPFPHKIIRRTYVRRVLSNGTKIYRKQER